MMSACSALAVLASCIQEMAVDSESRHVADENKGMGNKCSSARKQFRDDSHLRSLALVTSCAMPVLRKLSSQHLYLHGLSGNVMAI